ncbi:MAG: protein-L-isoaspartate(D-aspartate) O-methyltransferase [Solirubrobacteraceae bacterium]
MSFDSRQRFARRLARTVLDERVVAAVVSVPRELFVPPELSGAAWHDRPLPIGVGQTISQPMLVARMCELLEVQAGERVLDIGTGSGYHAAVLSRLAGWVWGVERHPELVRAAAASLAAAGIDNVTLLEGDGGRGHPDEAPYDVINVAAAASTIEELATLEDQLAVEGRMIAPVGRFEQELILVHRGPAGLTRTAVGAVRFVPLV